VLKFRNSFLLFVVIALTEVLFFIAIGERIGVLWTLIGVLLTASLGVVLLRQQGLKTLLRLQQKVNQGQLPAAELIEGVLLLIAGALLLTPGFLTDAVGFVLLCRPSRILFAKHVIGSNVLAVLLNPQARTPYAQTRTSSQTGQRPRRQPPSGETIEGEFEEKPE